MSAIDDKWHQIPWIGNPKDEGAGSQEMTMPDGRGRARDFDNGTIYWTQQTGAHEIHGDIRVCHATRSWLGYPLTDELGTPDGVGRFNHFEHGSIYWTPTIGAHEVHGAIRQAWAANGFERGRVGYPTSDEHASSVPGGRRNDFERGFIDFTRQHGARVHSTVIDEGTELNPVND